MDIGKLFKDAWGLYMKDVGPLIVGVLLATIIPTLVGVIIAFVSVGSALGGLTLNEHGAATGLSGASWVLLAVGLCVLVVATVLLTEPLYAGVLLGIVRRVREGRQMSYGDAFAGFQMFGRVVVAYGLVYVLIPVGIVAVPVAIIVAGAVTATLVLVGLGVLLLIVALVALAYLIVSWAYVYPLVVDRELGAGDAMRESRTLVHGTGWWRTFLVLLVLSLVLGVASAVLSIIPVAGSFAAIVITPFGLTYLMAMYFQARGEGQLVDAALGNASTAAGTPYAYTPAPPPPPPAGGQGYAPVPAPPVPPAPPVQGGQAYPPAPPGSWQAYAPGPPATRPAQPEVRPGGQASLPLAPDAEPADQSPQSARPEAQPASPEAPPPPSAPDAPLGV